VLFALAVMPLVSCSGAPPPAAKEGVVVNDRAAVEAATAAFHQALRTNDLGTFMSYVAEDVFFMPTGEPPVRGRDAMRTWTTAFLAQAASKPHG